MALHIWRSCGRLGRNALTKSHALRQASSSGGASRDALGATLRGVSSKGNSSRGQSILGLAGLASVLYCADSLIDGDGSGKESIAHMASERASRLLAWGSNNFGELGLGGTKNEISPCPVEYLEGTEIQHLDAYEVATAAVTKDGRIFTWGCGSNDRLGHGHTLDQPNQSIPREVTTLKGNISKVACGGAFMAGLTPDGKVFTWGRAAGGALGHSNSNPGIPTQVAGELAGKVVVDIACGRMHAVAMTADGSVYTWGSGRDGALGHGRRKDERAPRRVEGLKGVVAIGAGREHSIFLCKDSDDSGKSTIFTCGRDDYGQLGLGRSQRFVTQPSAVGGISGSVEQIAVGELHSAAIVDGKLYTWGKNKDGQLGLGSTMDQPIPTVVEGVDGTAVSVACGDGHTAITVRPNGVMEGPGSQLWMMGRGRSGQLGRGNNLESNAAPRVKPVQVDLGKGIKSVDHVALGADHSLCIVSE
eukprot:g3633.t1